MVTLTTFVCVFVIVVVLVIWAIWSDIRNR